MMCHLVMFLAGLSAFVSGQSPPDPETGRDVVVHRLEKMLTDLTKRVEDLEGQRQSDILDMSILRHDMEEIKYENGRLKAELNRVTSDHIIQHSDNTHNKPQQINSSGLNIDSGVQDTDRQQEDDKTMKNGSKTVEAAGEVQHILNRRSSSGPYRTKRVASNGNVAFFSSLKHMITNIANEQAIPFENVVTNNGGHYSQNSGVFTCPIEGAYVFSWTIFASGPHFMNQPYNYIDSELVKNSVAMAYSRAGDTDYDEASSTTAIVNLSPGDQVWVRVKGRSPNTNIRPVGSMFSGFKI